MSEKYKSYDVPARLRVSISRIEKCVRSRALWGENQDGRDAGGFGPRQINFSGSFSLQGDVSIEYQGAERNWPGDMTGVIQEVVEGLAGGELSWHEEISELSGGADILCNIALTREEFDAVWADLPLPAGLTASVDLSFTAPSTDEGSRFARRDGVWCSETPLPLEGYFYLVEQNLDNKN